MIEKRKRLKSVSGESELDLRARLRLQDGRIRKWRFLYSAAVVCNWFFLIPSSLLLNYYCHVGNYIVVAQLPFSVCTVLKFVGTALSRQLPPLKRKDPSLTRILEGKDLRGLSDTFRSLDNRDTTLRLEALIDIEQHLALVTPLDGYLIESGALRAIYDMPYFQMPGSHVLPVLHAIEMLGDTGARGYVHRLLLGADRKKDQSTVVATATLCLAALDKLIKLEGESQRLLRSGAAPSKSELLRAQHTQSQASSDDLLHPAAEPSPRAQNVVLRE